jgi:phage gp36-like protein
MPYATKNEFVEAFEERETVELTNLEDPTAITINTVRLDRALIDGASEIDSYLWRYQLPLSASIAWFKPCNLDIAIYRLYQHQVPDDVRNRYLDWIKKLEMVATGKLRLPATAIVEPTANTTFGNSLVVKGDRTYTNNSLGGFTSNGTDY